MPAANESATPLADLVLHPIRLRILQRLLGRDLTTTELKADLPDVPATTLYRHVSTLIEAGVVTVVSERRIRGATERTLSFDQTTGGKIGETEAKAMTVEQHRTALVLLLTRLLADFDRLVDRGDLDTRLDQLGYSQLALYIDRDDTETISTKLLKVLEPYLRETPGKDRVLLSLITLPDE
jgi:DNA-binding transcriptional ArsR family regulator